jgi:hypothetical protein
LSITHKTGDPHTAAEFIVLPSVITALDPAVHNAALGQWDVSMGAPIEKSGGSSVNAAK